MGRNPLQSRQTRQILRGFSRAKDHSGGPREETGLFFFSFPDVMVLETPRAERSVTKTETPESNAVGFLKDQSTVFV